MLVLSKMIRRPLICFINNESRKIDLTLTHATKSWHWCKLLRSYMVGQCSEMLVNCGIVSCGRKLIHCQWWRLWRFLRFHCANCGTAWFCPSGREMLGQWCLRMSRGTQWLQWLSSALNITLGPWWVMVPPQYLVKDGWSMLSCTLYTFHVCPVQGRGGRNIWRWIRRRRTRCWATGSREGTCWNARFERARHG